ncbi:hypothetical protein PSPO01_15136 [Paraphaeosphaeria sporulosa]
MTRSIPLHKVPHYCFGSVAGSTKFLHIYIFFPELHLESQYEHTTYLGKEDQELWIDAALLAAFKQAGFNSTILCYIPASQEIAARATTAASAKAFKQKETSRAQLISNRLQHSSLDRLWTTLLRVIEENPGLARFKGASLFVNAKNTKLDVLAESLPAAYGGWQNVWAACADPQFYSKDTTFIDFAKTVTSEDIAYPNDSLPPAFQAETYLWRRCCLEAYTRTCVQQLGNGKRARGSPRVVSWPWATTRDSIGPTLTSTPEGQERVDGLVYSQFYANLKNCFEDTKVYVFHNPALELLALDPSYIQTLQQQGGGPAFTQNVLKKGYLHSKGRANANLKDGRDCSYGIREEHRVSLTMMEEICSYWEQWDLYDDSIYNEDRPLPYYVVPTRKLLEFLSAQMNKYCFLFEYTLANTATTYSLPETMAMVIALRALRHCYRFHR